MDWEVWKMLGDGVVLAGAAFAPSVFESTRTESTVTSQGHQYNAVIVMLISREFENVLVEQNHCQGLKRVMRSWQTQSTNIQTVMGSYSQLPRQYCFLFHIYFRTSSTCNSHQKQQKLLAKYLASLTRSRPGTEERTRGAP